MNENITENESVNESIDTITLGTDGVTGALSESIDNVVDVSDSDADTAKDNTPITTDESNTDAQKLKNEIDRLRSLLEEKEAEQTRILNELGEFSRLFPDVTVNSIPAPVWKRVENGLPLSAAYALYEREESIRQYKANAINAKNASLSAGSAGAPTGEEYFSPEEVRKMTQKEVHENFAKIKHSMKLWR